MADCRQHGKGQHDQRDVPVPAVPKAGLIMVKSQFVLRRLKSILDGPTMALDPHQRLNGGASGAPGGEKGHLAIGKVTPDQQAPRPQPRPVLAMLIGLEVSQRQVGPIVQTRTKPISLGTCAAVRRFASFAQACGRYSARSMKAWPWRQT